METYFYAPLASYFWKFSEINGMPVMNREFKNWEGDIEYALRKRASRKSGSGQDVYDPEKELLTAAEHHIEKNSKSLKRENVLVLTHPFYLQMSHMNRVKNDETLGVIDNYLKNLFRLLIDNRNSKYLDIVLLETLHCYCGVTSLLLENELISRVYLTHFDSGVVMKPEKLKSELSTKKLFLAGGYNGRCFTRSLEYLPNTEKYFFMPEFIFNSPSDSADITVKAMDIFTENNFSSDNNLTLGELTEKYFNISESNEIDFDIKLNMKMSFGIESCLI